MKQTSCLTRPLALFLSLCLLLFISPSALHATEQEAIFAGGCFWCLEHDLESLPGVISVDSGYSGGDLSDPTYRNHKGHQEAVIVRFDAMKTSYENLLRSYWRNVDPLDGDGQFCDRGDSYRPVIFVRDENQREYAIKSLELAAKELGKPSRSIQVEIKRFKKFWFAEDYHQDFAEINPVKYNFYRFSCGRDNRLNELWGERARTSKEWKVTERI